MQVLDFIKKVRELIIDPDGDRWSDDEIMSWLHSGYNQIGIHRPDSHTALITHVCSAGALQTLDPSLNGPLLLSVKRNILTDVNGNETSGTPVHLVSYELADSLIDTWYQTPAESDGQVIEYMYDDRIQDKFYVYPNATNTTKLEILVSTIPAEHTDTSELIPINVRYIEPLIDYVIYRAYLRDSDSTHSSEMANRYLQSFANTLGIKLSVETTTQPDAITGDTNNG